MSLVVEGRAGASFVVSPANEVDRIREALASQHKDVLRSQYGLRCCPEMPDTCRVCA